MKLLFICKHNRFRSKVAEAIFNKLNKNKKIKAQSAGILLDEERLYIAENVLKIVKEKGYDIINKTPHRITSGNINDYDILVIVANNVEKDFFNDFKGKIIKWEISDANESEYEKIKKIIEEIESNVIKLIKRYG